MTTLGDIHAAPPLLYVVSAPVITFPLPTLVILTDKQGDGRVAAM